MRDETRLPELVCEYGWVVNGPPYWSYYAFMDAQQQHGVCRLALLIGRNEDQYVLLVERRVGSGMELKQDALVFRDWSSAAQRYQAAVQQLEACAASRRGARSALGAGHSAPRPIPFWRRVLQSIVRAVRGASRSASLTHPE